MNNKYLTKEEADLLDCNFEGVEFCPHCEKETNFVFNPIRESMIVCEHCFNMIHPCSLCSGELCGDYSSCKESIFVSLLKANDMWNEK
jgi:hypothetical protein